MGLWEMVKTPQVACGDDHTVLLTELGQLLTFGGGAGPGGMWGALLF